MVLKIFCHSCVTCASTTKIGRTLPDRQVQSFDERGVQLRGILRPEKGFLEPPAGADDAVPIDLDDSVFSSRLHYDSIDAGKPEDPTDHPSVILESVGCDQGRFCERAPVNCLIQKLFRIGVASSPNDGRWPQTGPYLHGSKYPRLPVLTLRKALDFIGLQLSEVVSPQPKVVKSFSGSCSTLEPAVDCVPGFSFNPGDG